MAEPISVFDLYADLLKRALANLIYLEFETPDRPEGAEAEARLQKRLTGRDWPPFAPTMIGWRRLENLHRCVAAVLREQVPGDLFEAGVWRGGAGILMRGLLAAAGDTTRRVWLADSFEGLPPPDPERYPADAGDVHHTYAALKVGLAEVKRNFARFNLLDDRLVFVKGFFSDTLPACPVERIAVLRLDGDMYEPTIVSLRALYDKVSPGGFIIVDDYGYIASCRQAVADFAVERGLFIELTMIDWSGAYWRKPS